MIYNKYAKVKFKKGSVYMYMKVKGYRNMLNMTQEQLGEYLGITKQSYHLKEVGKAQFTDQEKIKIKQLLQSLFPEITIDEIFF